MNTEPLFKKHEIPLTGITFFQADKKLIEKATGACDKLLRNINLTIPANTLKEFEIKSPKYISGTIASGDQFISDHKKTTAILEAQSETTAVEMEGAALAQVCHDHDIPFVVIRTISDRADHTAHIDFPKFIENIARKYSENIVKNMFSI
jgi:adenosylhomocysteine nucleosidase